jgi:RimJ/RimL family protein N-acetyltransferase
MSFRPIAASDADALVRFHEALSPESQRTRFFAVHPHLSEREVDRFTQVDHIDREAVVAIEDGEIVAVGRYERLPDRTRAEVAFVTRDDHQGSGLASALLRQLAASARVVGISTFVAQTLVGNSRMLRVFDRSGFAVAATSRDGVVDTSFVIDS